MTVLRFRSAAGSAFWISAIRALLRGIGVVGGLYDGHSVVASLRVVLVCRRPWNLLIALDTLEGSAGPRGGRVLLRAGLMGDG